MARITDDSKIEKIKEAIIKLVVSEGYGGASVSKIAKLAGVAEGYLYRYYSSKNELITSLLHTCMTTLMDEIEALLEEGQSMCRIVEETVKILFKLASEDTPRMKFTYVLLNDYNFSLDAEMRNRIIDICTRIHSRGEAEGVLRISTQPEDIYIMAVSYPIQFINHRLKGSFGTTELNVALRDKVTQTCITALTTNK